jgi:hypothetical protein
MKTLNLSEAAAFLHMHPEELRTRAKRGVIPGAKIGRRWVFIEDDLAEYIRSLYPVKRQSLTIKHSAGRLRQDVATDRRAASTEIREADRSRASGPPSSSEQRDVRTAGQDEELRSRYPKKRQALPIGRAALDSAIESFATSASRRREYEELLGLKPSRRHKASR